MSSLTASNEANFWQQPLESLTQSQWELLCDGCGRCCLKKLQVPLAPESTNAKDENSLGNKEEEAHVGKEAYRDKETQRDKEPHPIEEVHYTRVICRYYQQNFGDMEADLDLDEADGECPNDGNQDDKQGKDKQEDSLATGCGCYQERTTLVPDCLVVKEHSMKDLHWMPSTCAYRLRFEGKPLYDWHPLISGNREAMVAEGIAVDGKVISEEYVHEDGLEEHVIRWVEAATAVPS